MIAILHEATTAQAENRLERSGLVVTPAWLAQRSHHAALVLLDVRDETSYGEGHIAGAIRLELAAMSRESDGVPGMLLEEAEFAGQMGALGITGDKTVILYDDNWSLAAARVMWALARYGHERVAVLNGGIDRWRDEGYLTVNKPSMVTATVFEPQPADEHLATRQWLRQRLGEPGLVLLDTRAPGEFAEGHLPGAICWDWLNGVPLDSWNALRPAGELQEELARLGVTPEKEIVTYCQSGVRAAHTYLLLRHLGFPRVRLYDGSWLDWARHAR